MASLVVISIGITNSAIRLKIYIITAGIKYKSITKKQKKKHNKSSFLIKSKLNSKDVLISEALINSVIGHDKFVSINILLTEFYNKKKF